MSVIESGARTNFQTDIHAPPPSSPTTRSHHNTPPQPPPNGSSSRGGDGTDNSDAARELEMLKQRLAIAEQGWADAEAEAEFLAQGVLDLGAKKKPISPKGPAAAAAAAASKGRRNSGSGSGSGGGGGGGGGDVPSLSSVAPPPPLSGMGAMKAALAEAARKRNGGAAAASDTDSGGAAGAAAGGSGGGRGGASDPKFKMYKMMKSSGVPEPAITRKMLNDGLTEGTIESNQTTPSGCI